MLAKCRHFCSNPSYKGNIPFGRKIVENSRLSLLKLRLLILVSQILFGGLTFL